MKLEQLLEKMEKEGVDGFFISSIDNVRYISGYTSDDAYLFVSKKKRYFITDPRYTEQAGIECPDYTLVNWRTPNNTIGDSIAACAAETGCRSVAFEGEILTYSDYATLQQKVKAELVAVSGWVEELRSIKTKEEIDCLRAACDISCSAFERIIKDIRVGVTEKELASKLSHYMVMEGADTQPYGNILISGARTSLLHGIPSAKSVEYGDLVLMDFGCQYHGYLSDMTRTVVVGKASDKQREVYSLCRKMTEAGTEQMLDGKTGIDVYNATLPFIQNTEYFPYHYSGIGHGIGVFVHEIPFMGPRSIYTLKKDMVVTIEPGLYIPGWGGIRIEDQILVGENKNENLIWATHELIEL
jgi:Xaa-Pro aminopeptidase